jgi:hypothetical protein
MGFWTLKTERQIERERYAAGEKAHTLSVAHGIRSGFDDQRAALDKLQARSNAFLGDIEDHFGADTKYLTPEYTGRSKFENIDGTHDRRFGMKWVTTTGCESGLIRSVISFVYTESVRMVRLDYTLETNAGKMSILNEDYDGNDNNLRKDVALEATNFSTIRRYKNHAEFASSGDRPPKWFIDALKASRPAAR